MRENLNNKVNFRNTGKRSQSEEGMRKHNKWQMGE